ASDGVRFSIFVEKLLFDAGGFIEVIRQGARDDLEEVFKSCLVFDQNRDVRRHRALVRIRIRQSAVDLLMVFYTQLSDLRQHFDEDVGGRLGIVDRPVVLGKLYVVLLCEDVQAMLLEVLVYRAGKFKRIDDTLRIRTETDLLIWSLDESPIETCVRG